MGIFSPARGEGMRAHKLEPGPSGAWGWEAGDGGAKRTRPRAAVMLGRGAARGWVVLPRAAAGAPTRPAGEANEWGGLSALARAVADGLQVEDFGHLEAGRHHALAVGADHGPHTNAGREVAHASVQLGDEGDGTEVEGRRVDEQGQGLPLLGGEAGRIGQGRDLGRQGLLGVNLAVDDDDALRPLAREALDLGQVFVGERVGEVEEEHG